MTCPSSDTPDPNTREEDFGLSALALDESAHTPSEPIPVADIDAVEVRGVLSMDECARLVDALRRRTDWLDKCAKKHIRDSEGVTLPDSFGSDFAAMLGARLGVTSDGLPEAWRERVVKKGVADGDVGTEGTWAPLRVNERVRATRHRAAPKSTAGRCSPRRASRKRRVEAASQVPGRRPLRAAPGRRHPAQGRRAELPDHPAVPDGRLLRRRDGLRA